MVGVWTGDWFVVFFQLNFEFDDVLEINRAIVLYNGFVGGLDLHTEYWRDFVAVNLKLSVD